MKKNKRIISAALAASMLLPCFATAAVSANAAVVSDENSVSVGDYDLMDNIQDGVIFHELRRKIPAETREEFYARILQVMAQLGGGSANVL